jgi:hypothetical protein
MDDDASYIWKDQVQVHKRQPGLEGTKVTEEEFIMSPEPAHLLGEGMFTFERREYNEGVKVCLWSSLKRDASPTFFSELHLSIFSQAKNHT